MTYHYIASVIKQGTAAGTGTSAAIDTTGADLLISVVASSVGASGPPIADSEGNLWFTNASFDSGSSGRLIIATCQAPATSPTHTFSATGANSFASLAVGAYGGSLYPYPFDQTSGDNASGASVSSLQPGAITPAENNELIFLCFGDHLPEVGTAAVNSGMTIRKQAPLIAGTAFAVGFADLVQGALAAINPTLTFTACPNAACLIASFKASAEGLGRRNGFIGG